ncbi:hypothetical protein [Paenibacillus sp. N3.4]|uniref:hypothetical protein n=1 Tax=Paenibacillus sp. N3.4 TaxID=2603222 RepID=UPI0011C984A5|nr:hypothetical protein [Paenibacillus sp. N3.4]TXK85975.1 hypothetical protein FU659_00520 [Paenibacillus sp. N3.4]
MDKNTSQAIYGTSWLPGKLNESNEFNEEYDDCLKDIYRTIHKLGSEATKRHIESIHILEDGV